MVGLLHIAAISLVVAGALKIRNPGPTVAAMDGVGLPANWSIVVALALGEIATGVAVLVVGNPLATWSLAALYAGFALFMSASIRRQGSAARCGCFGASDAPPSAIHVSLNVAIAATAVWYTTSDGTSVADVVVDQPAAGIPYLLFVGIGSAAMFLVLDRLPRLQAAMEAAS